MKVLILQHYDLKFVVLFLIKLTCVFVLYIYSKRIIMAIRICSIRLRLPAGVVFYKVITLVRHAAALESEFMLNLSKMRSRNLFVIKVTLLVESGVGISYRFVEMVS